ncbi:hypothetical protein LUZ60_015076 [Juncus effusus]|nr:hypothetical protein LUZ60_015076 [Juncus effusus]
MTSPETLTPVPGWLQTLPRAPEYRPTETEFADPISFISKIEKEAATFGICKIIPPYSRPSKKFVFANLNSSLSQNSSNSSAEPAQITTRHQELGSRKTGVPHQQVWQSGELYTLDQFESKARAFYKSRLSGIKEASPLQIETQFWKAAGDKPIYIEYANDVPGSGFAARKGEIKTREPGSKLSESPWNLQVIARAHGSLTKFMPDDVSGVTSPMVYIGMLYSWFAWHVEDHELHSLNYLHFGAPKTWYAVPGGTAGQLEEIVRVKGYGGTLDRLGSLAMLGEKTTLISPEVIIASGVPCCRLVQNPGEFVVTFPRAYHVGFSHGFNCGEAANFATPQWLKFAREAAVRRAAMNFLPMLSHQQLLYLLAISFISRNPSEMLAGARTSRLRDRKKEDRELLIKKAFLQDMINENKLLCELLSTKSTSHSVLLWEPNLLPCNTNSNTVSVTKSTGEDENGEEGLPFGLRVDSGSLTCVACGILGYPFMAVVQPLHEELKEVLSTNDQKKDIESADMEPSKSQEDHQAADSTNTTTNNNINKETVFQERNRSSEQAGPTDSTSSETVQSRTGEDGSVLTGGVTRPRLFCLQHALETEQLLSNKGGCRVFPICHSDYLKIKAVAISIAEETGTEFNCTDINLTKSSNSDLNLINISIDDEGHVDDGTDWTAKLGLNLKYCVRIRKQNPKFQNNQDSSSNLALGLWGLFDGEDYEMGREEPKRVERNLNGVSVKWVHRKPRTPYKIVGTVVDCVGTSEWIIVPVGILENPNIDQIKGELNVSVETSSSMRMESPVGKVVCYTRRVKREYHEENYNNNNYYYNNNDNNDGRDLFIRSPCEGLRPRKVGPASSEPLYNTNNNILLFSNNSNNKSNNKSDNKGNKKSRKRPYLFRCDKEGCKKKFRSSNEMAIHKRYRCAVRFGTNEFEIRYQRRKEEEEQRKNSNNNNNLL